jgi:hypothetical protein
LDACAEKGVNDTVSPTPKPTTKTTSVPSGTAEGVEGGHTTSTFFFYLDFDAGYCKADGKHDDLHDAFLFETAEECVSLDYSVLLWSGPFVPQKFAWYPVTFFWYYFLSLLSHPNLCSLLYTTVCKWMAKQRWMSFTNFGETHSSQYTNTNFVVAITTNCISVVIGYGTQSNKHPIRLLQEGVPYVSRQGEYLHQRRHISGRVELLEKGT